jgi:hypothetical protein
MTEVDRLEEFEGVLAARGGDGLRVLAVRRTRRFKHSWIELAEALLRVRRTGAYRRWGFDDFHAYCGEELRLRRTTVDKLTGSFATLERHAPEILERDGIRQPIPSVDSVDYLARALGLRGGGSGGAAANDGALGGDAAGSDAGVDVDPETEAELRAAVFDDGASLRELRRRYDEVFFPQPEDARTLERLERARGAARRLERSLDDVTALPPGLAADAERVLGELRELFDARIADLRGRLADTG